MENKNLYVIAGCNGAGKTTASFTILPEILVCNEFVNADEIAIGLSPFQPEKVGVEAGRIMISRINNLLEDELSFCLDKFFKYNNDELFNVLVNDKDFKFVENIGLVR